MPLSGVELANTVFADGPTSNPQQPQKVQIRKLLTAYESAINAGLSNGGLIYDTKAHMDADTSQAANASAWVIGDDTAANNGIYRFDGTSTWTRVGDLPYSVVYAQNAGAGTADAVQATTSVPISTTAYSQLISVPFTAENTDAMTLSINGETPRDLVTNTGDVIPSGYVKAGMAALVQIDSGGDYRLFSYGDASAIQAAAEAARDAAAASATAAAASAAGVDLPAVTANTMLVDNAAGTARESKTFEEVRALLGTIKLVASVVDLRALNTSAYSRAHVFSDLDGGIFAWDSSDLSASGAVSRPCCTSSAVSSSTGIITATAHKLLSRQAVCVTTAENGLATETVYYVIKVDDDSFKLASSFANAVAGTAITLTGTTNITVHRLMDPLQGVYVIPTGASITGSDGAWTRSDYIKNYDLNVGWWGAKGDATTDDTAAFFFMLDFCEKQLRGGQNGGRCYVPKGFYKLTSMLRVGTWTTLQGAGMYCSTLWFTTDYTAGNCIELGPDNCVGADGNSVFGYFGSYTFGTLIFDLDIKGDEVYRGFSKAIVYTQGAHQPSGLYRCFVRDVVSYGIYWDKANGGPANFTISHCDIQGANLIPSTGTKEGIVCNGAAAIIDIDTCNIQGDSTNYFDKGISMYEDNLTSRGLHFECCTIGLSSEQNNSDYVLSSSVVGATSSGTTPTLIKRANSARNKLVVVNAFAQSIATTGLKVIDNDGTVVATDGVVAFFNSDA